MPSDGPTRSRPIDRETEQAHLQFRKKPVTIEAFQMTRERRQDNSDWPGWLHEAWNKTWGEAGAVSCEDYPNSDGADHLVICTLEGPHLVGWGDWIIRGVKGELYPCKPDIFKQTYEPADAILSAMPGAVESSEEAVTRSFTLGAIVSEAILGGEHGYESMLPEEFNKLCDAARQRLRGRSDRPAPVVDRERFAISLFNTAYLDTGLSVDYDSLAWEAIPESLANRYREAADDLIKDALATTRDEVGRETIEALAEKAGEMRVIRVDRGEVTLKYETPSVKGSVDGLANWLRSHKGSET